MVGSGRGRVAVLSLALLSLAGCTAGGTLAAFEPTGGGKSRYGILFNPVAGERATLDVFAPKAGAAGRPVVVFFYGGGFRRGKKSMYSFVGKALQAHGYVAVVPDYRLYPEVSYPAFLTDGSKAVRWARDHASEYGGDPRRMVLMGHSAGGYIAAMLANDPRWLAAEGMDPRKDLKGWIGLAGGYGDIWPALRRNGAFASADDGARVAAHVEPGSPAALLLAGDGDWPNSDRLAQAIRPAGGRVEAIRYPKLGHTSTVAALSARLRFLAPVYRDVIRFIDAVTEL